MEESLALCDVRFSIQKNEFDPWLRGLADSDIQRFVRARGTNVYGHDWRFQGADAAGAVAYGVLQMLILEAWTRAFCKRFVSLCASLVGSAAYPGVVGAFWNVY